MQQRYLVCMPLGRVELLFRDEFQLKASYAFLIMFTESRPNSAEVKAPFHEYTEGSGGTATAFLTLTLNGNSGQLHATDT
jgi:hypothetical protein